jgi:hypothetical protein
LWFFFSFKEAFMHSLADCHRKALNRIYVVYTDAEAETARVVLDCFVNKEDDDVFDAGGNVVVDLEEAVWRIEKAVSRIIRHTEGLKRVPGLLAAGLEDLAAARAIIEAEARNPYRSGWNLARAVDPPGVHGCMGPTIPM